jgi:L,D-transpeptidase catalytic domain
MHLSLAAALAAFTLVAAAPARADLLIQIDKSTQQMTVSEDGNLLYTWPVSTGRAGYNTPNGAFTPFRMDRDHYSREWDDAPMPYSIFFTKLGHAIHGTYEASHLGHAVSHGCVRLSVKHAAILWDLVKKNKMANTTVALTGEVPGGAGEAVARTAPQQREDADDRVASARAQWQVFGRNGWHDDDAPHGYYDRQQPYYDARPRGFFPFGW